MIFWWFLEVTVFYCSGVVVYNVCRAVAVQMRLSKQRWPKGKVYWTEAEFEMSCGSLEQKRQYTWLWWCSCTNRCSWVKHCQTLSVGITHITHHPFPAHLKTSNFSPKSLPHKVHSFISTIMQEWRIYIILIWCEKVEFESEHMLAFSNLLWQYYVTTNPSCSMSLPPILLSLSCIL